jgi:hypothetical protein
VRDAPKAMSPEVTRTLAQRVNKLKHIALLDNAGIVA